jgi:hypothetical protein
MEELKKAIVWYLERRPRSTFNIDEDFYLWVTDQLPVKTIPKVKIIYRVSDPSQTVILISIAEHVDQP